MKLTLTIYGDRWQLDKVTDLLQRPDSPPFQDTGNAIQITVHNDTLINRVALLVNDYLSLVTPQEKNYETHRDLPTPPAGADRPTRLPR